MVVTLCSTVNFSVFVEGVEVLLHNRFRTPSLRELSNSVEDTVRLCFLHSTSVGLTPSVPFRAAVSSTKTDVPMYVAASPLPQVLQFPGWNVLVVAVRLHLGFYFPRQSGLGWIPSLQLGHCLPRRTESSVPILLCLTLIFGRWKELLGKMVAKLIWRLYVSSSSSVHENSRWQSNINRWQ